MALQFIRKIVQFLPEVRPPIEKRLDFNLKLKWTLLVLVSFFVLMNVQLYGLAQNALEHFAYLAVILGTDFGSIISLGIGPIVMSSIILQLLVGSRIINLDMTNPEGKKDFQALQRVGVLFFILFEATVYVVLGGLRAVPGFSAIVIFQLILGGLAIMFMDEVSQKWGFGSGVSLFIVAGVARHLFTGLFQFLGPNGEICLLDFVKTPCRGNVLVVLQSVINGAPKEALLALSVILITIAVYLAVVWAQSLKVEIPLSYDRLRGYQIKWPLAFFYASNIPVILVAALLANLQLFGGIIENWVGHATLLGGFSQGQPISGLAFWLGSSNVLSSIIRGSLQTSQVFQALCHFLFYVIFSAVFSVFWVKTSGMDEYSQAKNIIASGLQMPGFRKDQRVLEAILGRYILPLTIMGGAAVGALSSIADLFGVITSGTSLLLGVMIMYQFYQNISHQHALDMHPAMKKMFSG